MFSQCLKDKLEKINIFMEKYTGLLSGLKEKLEDGLFPSLRNQLEAHEGKILNLWSELKKSSSVSPLFGLVSDSFDFLKVKGLNLEGLKKPLFLFIRPFSTDSPMEYFLVGESGEKEEISILEFKKQLGSSDKAVSGFLGISLSLPELEIPEGIDEVRFMLFPDRIRGPSALSLLKSNCDAFFLVFKDLPKNDFFFLVFENKRIYALLRNSEIRSSFEWISEDSIFYVDEKETPLERLSLLIEDSLGDIEEEKIKILSGKVADLKREIKLFKNFLKDWFSSLEEELASMDDKLEEVRSLFSDLARKYSLEISNEIHRSVKIEVSDRPFWANKRANRIAREIVEEYSDRLNEEVSFLMKKSCDILYGKLSKELKAFLDKFRKGCFLLEEKIPQISLEHEKVSMKFSSFAISFKGFLSFLISSLPSIPNLVVYVIIALSIWAYLKIKYPPPFPSSITSWIMHIVMKWFSPLKHFLLKILLVVVLICVALIIILNFTLYLKQLKINRLTRISVLMSKWRKSNQPSFFDDQIRKVLLESFDLIENHCKRAVDKVKFFLRGIKALLDSIEEVEGKWL